MRFGICYNVDYHPEIHGTPGDYYHQILQQCELLESLGYDSAWFSEHHSGPYSFGNPALMIAAAAMRTQRLKLGTGVSLLPLHHPVALSEEYAMLDQLTAGRLEYGVGRGYLMHEYPWMNVDAAQSAARYRESIDFITKAWTTKGQLSYQGDFYKVEGYTPFPSVVQTPIPPIYSSAVSPESYTFAGSKNLHLGVALFVPGIEALPGNLAAYERTLKENGHSRATREVMGITQMYCAKNESDAVAAGSRCARNYFNFFSDILVKAHGGPTPISEMMAAVDPIALNNQNQVLFGSPKQLIDKISRMRDDWGIDYLQLEVAQGGCKHSDVVDVLNLFGTEVIPHFR